ncbi:MAG: HAD family hydrolase [Leptolyngbyaceae bacterium]|nr:HAD family hydrolase [Leptolyngbyaceae bacterium]
MAFTPLSAATENYFQNIRFIATDMDGTLTHQGKFTQSLFQAFDHLANQGIQVLIITGRSAGWVSGLVHYLPVVGAIAENGGLFYPAPSAVAQPLTPITDLVLHRQQLAEVFQRLQAKFPDLQESSDNRFRLTDWTFDVAGLTLAEIQQLAEHCQAWGWGFTYSTVQCHIKPLHQDKATGLLQVLKQHFPNYRPDQILTVGDSPNDESLFNTSQFPLSVGVANVLAYADQLAHQPAYVTTAAEAAGFCELAKLITKG